MFNIGKPETTRDAKKNEGPSPFLCSKNLTQLVLPPLFSNTAANFIYKMAIPTCYDVFKRKEIYGRRKIKSVVSILYYKTSEQQS